MGFQVSERAHPGRVVDEPHAAGTAQRHPRIAGDLRDRLAPRRARYEAARPVMTALTADELFERFLA